ncbi:hypothetical protein [Candidatus Nitrosocosmicus franklandus]|uniref:Uncharacterized protein n=1 Tax=Candidatus Nitrosocosmicus franklandianus TaxID=1798806 RepID=A0A484IB34_9ARCH|nr:hypothetical protein [Candidatus Nitrosocosmicus franklandus]VFJ13437.1 conserved membrane protein of unknown function [Candidatus Nitrosocosmicus franklandus]
MQNYRPFGVTIIAVLLAIGGVGSLLSGITVLALIPLLGILVAGVFFVIGLAYFAVAYGLWIGANWAWIITLVLCGIAILVGIGSIVIGHVGSLFLIVLNGIVIYYLYQPNVKEYFGR